MIKEAISYIVGLGNNKLENVNGQQYSTQDLYLLEEPTSKAIELNSLTGLVDYIKSNFDTQETLTVHVESPTSVSLISSLNTDKNRNYLVKAKALLPRINFGDFMKAESFNIHLQSCFVKNEDRDILLKVVGNIKEESVKNFGDDGVSQSVIAKAGVTTVAEVKVPNPVSLKPFRTFIEIPQPASEFVFRMQDGPRCGIFEADGGAWKLQAMHDIKKYLEENLESEIEGKKIFIVA